MDMGTTTALCSFEDFERMPEDVENPGKTELLEGELIQMPPAEFLHMSVALKVYTSLARYLEAHPSPDLGMATIEFGYKIGPRTWLVPDVSIAYPGQPTGKYLEGAPLIAIEV